MAIDTMAISLKQSHGSYPNDPEWAINGTAGLTLTGVQGRCTMLSAVVPQPDVSGVAVKRVQGETPQAHRGLPARANNHGVQQPRNKGVEVNTVINDTEGESNRPFALLALLAGIIFAISISAVMPSLAAAGPTEYPVRFCSPAYVGQGTATHNGGIGPVTVFHKAANGNFDYGQVGTVNGGWNAFNPALRCGANNPQTPDGVANYGMRFFSANNSIYSRIQKHA